MEIGDNISATVCVRPHFQGGSHTQDSLNIYIERQRPFGFEKPGY